jgi:spermidine/putrescine transport system ATP-binding protein
MPAIIELQQLTKTYGAFTPLSNVSLTIKNGEFLTLLGPSGCGKTTLLRLIAGLEKPDKGTILIQDKKVNHLAAEKREVNMVFQQYALFPHLTVYENIAFGLRCKKLSEEIIEQRVQSLLQKTRLEKLASRFPAQLSGGQQQRTAIARAIVNQPLVLLLDEPLSALDLSLRKKMRLELKNLQRDLGITFVFVTHDQEEALSMSDRVVVMNHGEIKQIGSPRDIYEEPNSLYVAKFIGEANVFSLSIQTADPTQITYEVDGCHFSIPNEKNLQANDQVNIVIRPEDIHVTKNPEEQKETLIPGTVESVIYKGCTVDLIVTLNKSQHTLYATEFFNEDDEDLIYRVGESVGISWFSGWEVVLPHEKD